MNEGDALIVGLGNPGPRYENTWHNLGAVAALELGRRWALKFKPSKGDFLSAERKTGARKDTIMIPTSFMNRSGGPVAGWVRYYKINLGNVLAVFDDHDLPFGRIRLREGGASGGHKGLQDIIYRLNTELIPRLRIGIMTTAEHVDLSRQVLSKIPNSLIPQVDKVVSAAVDCIELVISDGIVSAANHYNGMDILGDTL